MTSITRYLPLDFFRAIIRYLIQDTLWAPESEQGYSLQRIPRKNTYGHSQLKTGHPVRSAIHKQLNGRLVLRWVTTWESLLL
ncbi:hypothetical protein KCV05_g19090, partial [Aureobasidium melanogenum]